MSYLGAHLSSAGAFIRWGRQPSPSAWTPSSASSAIPGGLGPRPWTRQTWSGCGCCWRRTASGPFVAHAPYIMNPCSKDEGIRGLAEEMMAGDLAVLEGLPGNYYNFHPGSHVGQGMETGCRMIADMLNAVLKPEQQTVVLLETMAGKGSEVGGRFEDLAAILSQVELSEKMGSAWIPATSPTRATTLSTTWTGCWRSWTGWWG